MTQNNRKYLYIAASLLLLLVVGATFSLAELSTTDGHTIDGDTVYIDDPNVYIGTTPHTV